MMKRHFFFLSLTVLFLFHCATTLAQSPAAAPAAAPGPPPPFNITKVLEKAGRFTVLIRLMKSTQEDDRINNQLSDSGQGLTMLAPDDNAFSSLKVGTLNSLTDSQKVQLLEFHIIPNFLAISQFQTLSNPINTQAGDSQLQFPLNITTAGDSSVNMTTGLVNASVGSTVYTDNQLAIYEVDKVLQPYGIFDPRPIPPSQAPAPSKSKKSPISKFPNSDDASVNSAVAFSITRRGVMVSLGVSLAAAFSL